MTVSKSQNLLKVLMLVIVGLLIGVTGHQLGMTNWQSQMFAVFVTTILSTLFYWDLRLSIIFLGTGILFFLHGLNIEQFVKFASFDVILFLVGMMVIVGALRDSGVVNDISMKILRSRHASATRIFLFILFLSALLSAFMGEVASIMVVMPLILEISKTLRLDPVPLTISAVMATNVGSAATLLGNPVGVLLALRAGLSFEDFLFTALPISLICLILTSIALMILYRKPLKEMGRNIGVSSEESSGIRETQPRRERFLVIGIFVLIVTAISLHHRLEVIFGLETNNLLIIIPIIGAALVMLLNPKKVNQYIEHDVEWNSILFFIFLFGMSGIISSAGIAQMMGTKIVSSVGNHSGILMPLVLFSTGILSSVLDNTVVVASYLPLIQGLPLTAQQLSPLWWSVLFGACFGGNITVIGSTANIVAIGLLEKETGKRINFGTWLAIGTLIGILTMGGSYLMLLIF